MPGPRRATVYASDQWEIDLLRRELRSSGVPVPLGSRAFDIVEILVQSPGRLVGKSEIMRQVWPDADVKDNTLHFHMSTVRKAFGPNQGMLKTAFGRGYRLVGAWSVKPDTTEADLAQDERTWMPGRSFQNNLPATVSTLIGRAASKKRLRHLLSEHRAVTLSGPSGIGKTSLALNVVRDLVPDFPGDIWLVELAHLSVPDLVPSAVADAVGLKLGGGDISAASICRAIGDDRVLIVLDNCEHVVDAAAELVDSLLGRCRNVFILATSQEILRIDGEYVYRVRSLDVPPQRREEANDILGCSAVQLFIARANALNPDFSLRGEDLSQIGTICRRLDGIPLAIELAAARAGMIGVHEVAARLDHLFGLLTDSRRTALPRHRTLRSAIDRSYELLPDFEQRLLRRLAIFSGGFTLAAASAIMRDSKTTTSMVLEAIGSLVAKSLVTLRDSSPDSRWHLLETIRAYGLEKLSENGEGAQIARLHGEFFRDFVLPAGLQSRLEPDEMAPYAREISNVRAALHWSFSGAGDPAVGIVLTAAYVPVWAYLHMVSECRERAEQAWGLFDANTKLDVTLKIQLGTAVGFASVFAMGSAERGMTVLLQALEVSERLDDVSAQVPPLRALVHLTFYAGDIRARSPFLQRLLRIAQQTGGPASGIAIERTMGNHLQLEGSLLKAQDHLECALEGSIEPMDRHSPWAKGSELVLAHAMLARVLWLRGYVDQAMEQALISFRTAQATGCEMCRVVDFGTFLVAAMTGDLVMAERAVARHGHVATTSNSTYWTLSGQCLQGELLIRHGEFDEGLHLLSSGLEALERSGWLLSAPRRLGVLAEGMAGVGQFNEALATIDKALAIAERGGERWCDAELLRIKGELHLQHGKCSAITMAETCFQEALGMARQQGALSWELRAALSLAHLRLQQDRPAEARCVLAPVYDRFTEGFETADLQRSKALLDSLSVI